MLDKIHAISALLKNSASKERTINSALPVMLDILEKERETLYKIKIGNLTTNSKSNTPLNIGQKYFATLRQTEAGLVLNNLTPYPKGLEILDGIKAHSTESILEGLKNLKEDLHSSLHHAILGDLASSKSKDEFLFIYQQLLSLQKGVLNFLVNEDGKNSLLQMKKTEENKLDFYALFANLGSINGAINMHNNRIHATIYAQFPGVVSILKRDVDSLGFDSVQILLARNIKPLHTFSAQLLDLKG